MLFYTAPQSTIFLAMLVAGVAMGACYGLCELTRRALRAGFWLSLATDAVCAALCCALLLAALYVACYAEMRAYCLIAACLGFALERVTLGKLTLLCAKRAAALCVRAARALLSRAFVRAFFR